MNNNYKKLYKKYKKKYLIKKQELLNGGLLAMDNEQDSKKCPLNSVYIIPPCNLNFPCLKNDGLCYNFDDGKFNDESVNKTIVSQIFSSNDKAVIIYLDSFFGNKNQILISNLLGRGGDSNVFAIKDINDIYLNMVIRLTKNKSYSNEYIIEANNYKKQFLSLIELKKEELIKQNVTEDDSKKIIDNFKNQLSRNVNTSLNRKFPTKEQKFRDFTSMNIQYELSSSPYINSIIDYGRFRFSLDNANYYLDLKSVLSITEDYNQSYIGTYSILEKCEGGDLKTRYDNNKDIFKKINVLRKLFENILLGIDVIHSNGYIHRDLKPENIGLKYSLDKNYGPSIGDFEKNTEIEILDFGLATKIGKYTYPAGTREFFSPDIQSKFIQTKRAIDNQNLENIKEDRFKKYVSKKDDIFAVGIMLFDLIHGYSSIQGEIIDNDYLIDFNYEVTEGNIILSDFEEYDELLFVIFDKENKKIFIEKSEIEDEEFIFKKLPKFLGDNTNIDNLKYVLYSPEKVRSTPIQYDLFRENTHILNDSLISFLDGMLSIEEDDRFDVNTALSHEWIKTKRLSDKEVNPKKVAKVTIEPDNLN